MTRRLLFVTYGGGHAHMVYPVVQALRSTQAFADGRLAIDVLGLPAATPILRAHGVESLGFRDFVDSRADAEALAWGARLAEAHHSPTIGVPLEDSVAYLGLSYQDLVIRHGADTAAAMFEQRGRHAFLPLSVMERVFDRLRPDAVVTTNSPRSEAAAIATANARGLGSVIMADLFTGLGDYRLQARDITFLNAAARDMFVADGLADPAASRFHCTGNPAFDKILALPRTGSAAWREAQFPGTQGRKLVLHADMPAWWDGAAKGSHFKSQAELLAELKAVHAACAAQAALHLVRPHPSQDRAFYQRWVAVHPDARLASECNLHELLVNVDLLVCRTTTVGLEAAMLGQRILQLDWAQHGDLPLAAMGIAWGSAGYAGLAGEVGQALTDDSGFQAIRERTGKMLPSDPAAPQVAGIVLESLGLASERGPRSPS